MIVFVENENYYMKKHKHPAQFHLIGNTPLLDLSSLSIFSDLRNSRIFAKLEMMNLGGSVKDRIALYMIEKAETAGQLNGKIILEPTSGNTGIGLAWIGQLKGYEVHLVMPDSMSKERQMIIKGYGAQIILTPGGEGMDGAIYKARELIKKYPNRYIMLDQFNNQANWEAHYHGTGPEIWEQTNGSITHLIAGIGTGGTLMGTMRFVKEKNPNLVIIGVQPSKESVIPGLKNIENAQEVPSIFRKEELNDIIYVNENSARAMTERLSKEASLLVGPSSGAALAGVYKYVLHTNDCLEGTVVTIFPDSGLKYLSQRVT